MLQQSGLKATLHKLNLEQLGVKRTRTDGVGTETQVAGSEHAAGDCAHIAGGWNDVQWQRVSTPRGSTAKTWSNHRESNKDSNGMSMCTQRLH